MGTVKAKAIANENIRTVLIALAAAGVLWTLDRVGDEPVHTR
jgi:hypothetical protein